MWILVCASQLVGDSPISSYVIGVFDDKARADRLRRNLQESCDSEANEFIWRGFYEVIPMPKINEVTEEYQRFDKPDDKESLILRNKIEELLIEKMGYFKEYQDARDNADSYEEAESSIMRIISEIEKLKNEIYKIRITHDNQNNNKKTNQMHTVDRGE